MERYSSFKFFFVFFLVVFLVLIFIDITFANFVVNLAYFLSLIRFIFRFEPPVVEHLEIPAVDYYRRSRFNSFNYIVVSFVIFTSIIFGFISVNKPEFTGIFSLIAWLGLITWIEILKRKFKNSELNQNLLLDYLIDRLYQKTKKRLTRDDVLKIATEYENKGKVSKKTLKDLELEFDNSIKLIEKWIEDYKYSQKDPLLIDEITEIR